VRPETLLYRQVHETWLQHGVPTSQTFRPTPKDDGKPSVYDGDIIGSAEASYTHWTEELNLTSIGVLAVTMKECLDQGLTAITDGVPFPAHATIDFTKCESKGEIRRLAGELTKLAMARDWQYRPPEMTASQG
jgi:hypothetical protein